MFSMWFLALLILLSLLIYKRASLKIITVLTAIWLTLGSFVSIVGQPTWAVFLLIAIPLNSKAIRHSFLTRPAMNIFKKALPTLSATEKEAIDAGTTWWESDLMRGQPDWQKLHNIPQPRLTPEEQAFLDGPVETLCEKVCDWQTTHHDADLSPEVWQYLKENKFFALIINKEFGGLEFSAYAQSRVIQKLMGHSTVLATTVGVPNSLGPAELLQKYGTVEQKQHYLPQLASGEAIPCFALTGPEAGSDAGAIPDSGTICTKTIDGEDVTGINLNFNKRYITLAPVATLIGLAFKLYDPDSILGDKKELGITCALIPHDTEGLTLGRRHFPLNIPFQNGPIQGVNVFVPLSAIIGGANMAGQGWRMLVECLSVGRAITLPSNAVGTAKTVSLVAGAYARIRRQFKMPIGKMEGIEEALAAIGGNTYLMTASVTLSTSGIDLGEKPSVISAICKYHLTERMRTVVNHGMDIQGGKGIMLGPNNLLGRSYQSAPIAITVEGANILTRNLIIFGQGAIRCHPFILAEMDALQLKDEVESLHAFDDAICGHIGFVISNKVRSFWLAWTNGRFTRSPFDDQTSHYYKQLSRYSAALAFMTDICLATFGGKLKRKERISARLGDMLSYLYLASATLKRFNDDGRQQHDLPFVKWALEDCIYKCQVALADLLDNFPISWLKYSFKIALLPWGITAKKPSDKTEHKIAQLMQSPSETRDRLSYGQLNPNDKNSVLGQFERALHLIIEAETIHNKIGKHYKKRFPFTQLDVLGQKALKDGVILESEADTLNTAEHARKTIINVDDFAPDALSCRR